jgi:hypothetical protein
MSVEIMVIREYVRSRTRKRTFNRAVDLWVSGEEGLGLFHPLVMAMADIESDHWLARLDRQIIEGVLTFWLDSWHELEDRLLSDLRKPNDVYALMLHDELIPIFSDYGEKLHCILSDPDWDATEVMSSIPADLIGVRELIAGVADDTTWDGSRLVSDLLAINEEARRALHNLGNWLDGHAAEHGLEVPTYRYSRKAAKRFTLRSQSRILNYLQTTSRGK